MLGPDCRQEVVYPGWTINHPIHPYCRQNERSSGKKQPPTFLSLHTEYLIQHRPHIKHCGQQFFYCCVFVDMGMCLQSCCLAMGLGRDTQTARCSHKSPFIFFQIKENRLKNANRATQDRYNTAQNGLLNMHPPELLKTTYLKITSRTIFCTINVKKF
jgi:hypothetical protein